MPQELEKSVLRILNQNQETVGAGFLVGDSLAVTCAHVIAASGSQKGGLLNVRFYLDDQSQPVLAQVLPDSWSPPEQDDVAFLRLRATPPGAAPLRLADSQNASGHNYTSLGFPKSAAAGARIAHDLIDGLVPAPGRTDLLQLKGEQVYQGMSGAPVLDLDLDRVVGMITMGQDERYTRIVYATPTEALQQYFPGLVVEDSAPILALVGKSPAEIALHRNLNILLNKVRVFWIDGVLERSIQGAALIPLAKRTCPNAVASPLAEDLPNGLPAAPAGETRQEFPDLFSQSGNALLIMDGAGSGKTTALLALAKESIRRAGRDWLEPVPVILNLANWPGQHLPLEDWILAEMSVKYQIPREIGKDWLANNRLALMLDGLDEVDPPLLEDCITAINHFRETNGLTSIAIASRTEDYLTAENRLRLGLAVQLEPLSDAQVEAYLEAGLPGTQPLREVLRSDADLWALAHSPQMLSMMRLAYGDVPVGAAQNKAPENREEQRARLLELYSNHMFEQHARLAKDKPSHQVDPARFRRWLGFLSRGMDRSGQSIFLVEMLQPGWLPGELSRWVYWLSTRILPALLLGLVISVTAEIGGSTLKGRLAYLEASLLAGLLFGLLDRWWMSPGKAPAARAGWAGWAYFVAAGLLGGLSYGLFFGLIVQLGIQTLLLMGGAALAFGILFGLSGKDRSRGEDIRPAQKLSWSWAQFRRGVLPAALISLAVLFYIPVGYLHDFRSLNAWMYSATFAVITLLGILGIYGLRGLQIDERGFTNQGIWIAVRNAALVGGCLGIGSGLIFGAPYGIAYGLSVGLRVGVLAALLYGGYEGLKHLLLRLLLAAGGHLPWNLPRMLDQAEHLHFLHRAGGGFLFVNRLLRNYFQQF